MIARFASILLLLIVVWLTCNILNALTERPRQRIRYLLARSRHASALRRATGDDLTAAADAVTTVTDPRTERLVMRMLACGCADTYPATGRIQRHPCPGHNERRILAAHEREFRGQS